MEEEGKGRYLIYRECQCFRQFQSFGRDTGRRKKGRGFYHKDASRQQDFFFECAENARFSGLLGDWRGLGEGKERKRFYCENALNSAKRQQGFFFGYAENDRFFDVF